MSIYGDVSITTGPIFDYNADGLRDYSVNNTRYFPNILNFNDTKNEFLK